MKMIRKSGEPSMSTSDLVEQSERLALDILNFAGHNNVSVHDVLMVTAIATRLLQSSLCGDDSEAVMEALQEADATYTAITTKPEPN